MSADHLERMMHECIRPGPGLHIERFEEIGRILGHELGTGPSDGLDDVFGALIKQRREREAALLIVPADWDISIVGDRSGRYAASIQAPCQDAPVAAIADTEGAAVLAALIAAIIAGPSQSPDTTSLSSAVPGRAPIIPFQQRGLDEASAPD